MKKLLLISMLFLALLICIACGPQTQGYSIESVSGLKDTYNLNEELGEISLVVKTPTGDSLTFSSLDTEHSVQIKNFDTTTAGAHTFTIEVIIKGTTTAIVYNHSYTVQGEQQSDDEQEVEIVSVTGIKEQYMINEEIDLTQISIEVKLLDQTTTTVNYPNFMIENLITSVVGRQTASITYKNLPVFEKDYKVTIITAVTLPNFVTQYLSNIAEQQNKEEEFIDRTQPYYVGNDNPFFFELAVKYSDGYTVMNLEEYTSISKLSIKNGDTFVDISENDLSQYVTIDEVNHSYLFTDLAIDNEFRLSVYPTGVAASSISTHTKTFDFTVIDGYNCYTALDVSYLDNKHDSWKQFRLEQNAVESIDTNAIIFQNDIVFDVEDIPSYFIYNANDSDVSPSDSDYQRVIGSLRDLTGEQILYRDVDVNDDFSLIGNFFNWDVSALPLVMRENGKITPEGSVISHATLLRINGSTTDVNTGNAFVRNIYLTGNAPRTEEAKYSGGIIFIKTEDVDTSFENMITRKWFTVYMPQIQDKNNTVTINNTKNYDSFSCFIYVWGHSAVEVSNSEFNGSGGPVVIADHVDPTNVNSNYISNVTFANCQFDSLVAGTEGWFNLVGATGIVPQIKSLNSLFVPYGKSFLKSQNDVSMMNLIAIVKSGNAQGLTSDDIKGSIAIDDGISLNFGQGTNALLGAYLTNLKPMGAPIFQSSMGGLAYTDGATGLYTINLQNGSSLPVDPTSSLFDGDYLNMYVSMGAGAGYMGLVLGYYDA